MQPAADSRSPLPVSIQAAARKPPLRVGQSQREHRESFNSSSSPKAAATRWIPPLTVHLHVSIQAAARKPPLPRVTSSTSRVKLFQFKQQPESRRYALKAVFALAFHLFQFKQQPESRRYATRKFRKYSHSSVSIQAAARKPPLPERKQDLLVKQEVSIQAAARKPPLPQRLSQRSSLEKVSIQAAARKPPLPLDRLVNALEVVFQFKQQPESRRYTLNKPPLVCKFLSFNSSSSPKAAATSAANLSGAKGLPVSIQAAARKPPLRWWQRRQRQRCFVSIQAAARKPPLLRLRGFEAEMVSFQFKQQPESRRYLTSATFCKFLDSFNSSSSPKAAATVYNQLRKFVLRVSIQAAARKPPLQGMRRAIGCKKNCFNSSSSPKAAATSKLTVLMKDLYVSIQAAARKPPLRL